MVVNQSRTCRRKKDFFSEIRGWFEKFSSGTQTNVNCSWKSIEKLPYEIWHCNMILQNPMASSTSL